MNQLKDEQQIIEQAKRNPEEFAKIYNHYYSRIFNFIYKRTLNFDISRDITSEVFLKAFISIGTFKWRGISIGNWLFRIAINEINLYHRQKKYAPETLKDSYGTMVFEKHTTNLQEEKEKAEKELLDHQRFIDVSRRLKQLPQKYQDVIALKYFEKLTIREISNILGIKEGTIKSLLSRGVKKLAGDN
ncbi:MAG: sigma-70 family RNA polymerase sigma factor [Aureisphaera sp.]